MGKSRIKEMMDPIEVANLFIYGYSRYARYLNGGDLLFDGGVVLTSSKQVMAPCAILNVERDPPSSHYAKCGGGILEPTSSKG